MKGRSPASAGGHLGGEQVEGRRAVAELLRAQRRPVRDVWLAERDHDDPRVRDIVAAAAAARVPVRWVAPSRLDAEARTSAPQGVLAHAQALEPVDLEDLCGGASAPLVVVVDGVTDPQNLGAILRSAEVAGATGVVLGRHRAVHITPAVAKAAAGAIEYLPVALVAGIPSALMAMKARGVWTVGLDMDGAASVFRLNVATEALALVLGAEGGGLGRLTRQRCDVVASIPQSGSVGSLNVAAAAAVACFEIARQRGEA